MNGFDRVAKDEESCFHGHRSLPPTLEEYAASLWSEVNALKDAIPMPRHKVSKLINAIGGGTSLFPYPLVRGTLLSGRLETRIR